MERLTEWSCLAGIMTGDLKAGVDERKAFDRLAAYEDTDLDPEEIEIAKDRVDLKFALLVSKIWGLADGRLNEILKAEKDGRLVVLKNDITVQDLQDEYYTAKRIIDTQLPSASYTTGRMVGFGDGVVHVLDKVLTREEAEAALKKREADNEAE